jgi:hypothetical protein
MGNTLWHKTNVGYTEQVLYEYGVENTPWTAVHYHDYGSSYATKNSNHLYGYASVGYAGDSYSRFEATYDVTGWSTLHVLWKEWVILLDSRMRHWYGVTGALGWLDTSNRGAEPETLTESVVDISAISGVVTVEAGVKKVAVYDRETYYRIYKIWLVGPGSGYKWIRVN